jgi:hypothetical protein
MKISQKSVDAVGCSVFGSLMVYFVMIVSPIAGIAFVFVMNKYFPDVRVSWWVAGIAIGLVGLDIFRSLVGTVNCIAIVVLLTISVVCSYM